MTVRAATPRWRVTWAQRENDRRRREFDSEAEAWHRRNDHLIRLQIEAAGFHGCTQPRNGLPVELGHDEVVYRVLPAAGLVEAQARHIAGLPTPGLTVTTPGIHTPGRGLPVGLRVVDVGMAVVTNHRVAFSGRESHREWTYADMVGPAHHPDVPLTLLHTTDGSRLAGLHVPATATVNFRFYLTLAFAAATGQRAAIAAQIDALLDGHQKTRPAPPPPANPDHAPQPALRPDRLAVAAALVALTFATLTAGTSGTEQAGRPYRANPGASDTAATTDAPNAIGATGPNTPTRSPTPASGTAASLTGTAATPPTGTAPWVDGPMPRQPRASGGTSAAPAVTVTGPAARSAPTTVAPTTTPPPSTGPIPTSAPPTPESPTISLCLEPLQLPLAERLLCPPTSR